MDFRIGDQPYWRNATKELVPAGKIVSLGAGEQPSAKWEPIDDEAKAELRKLKETRASRARLESAKLDAMSPQQLMEHIDRLVDAKFQAQMAAKSAPPSDPKKSPKKDDPPRGKEQVSPL